jgi:uncharacterized protein (DUF1499 family)
VKKPVSLKGLAMKLIGFIFYLAIAIAIILVIAGQLGLLTGKAPTNLGVKDGRLKPPSKTPNSVSSQALLYADHPQKEYAAIEPFKFSGDGAAAMEKLANLLQKQERTTLVARSPDYIYAQCATAVLKFTDDVEFWLDKPNNVIQVRSSSRLGRKDFEVNRARIESIRAQFNT